MSSRHRAPLESRVYAPAAREASDVELIPAGGVTNGVVRAGGTIRRPHQPQFLAVAAYLDCLEDAGSDRGPQFLGGDAALGHERMQQNAKALGGGWSRMWDEDGVGDVIRRRGNWLEANAERLVGALTEQVRGLPPPP